MRNNNNVLTELKNIPVAFVVPEFGPLTGITLPKLDKDYLDLSNTWPWKRDPNNPFDNCKCCGSTEFHGKEGEWLRVMICDYCGQEEGPNS